MGRARNRPAAVQEIEDAEFELVLQRVCAIDVAKASGMVCVRVPPSQGTRRRSTVQEVKATVAAITQLGAELVESGIEKVTVESTGDYWRIWFYVLESAGLDVQLVNARDAKNVPGRAKTDKLDSVWLAKLTERGMLRPSFVPPKEIRQLRDYTRFRSDLMHERTRHYQRLEKLLEDALIKVSTVASSMTTKSARDMLDALISGERDPRVLAELARGRMRSKIDELAGALEGRFDAHHGELARFMLERVDRLDEQIAAIDDLVTALLNDIYIDVPPTDDGPGAGTPIKEAAMFAVGRLDEIPGIGEINARAIIAEIGLDMGRFPTPAHLVSWAKLSPRTLQSGNKNTPGRTGKGNPYLKSALSEAAAGVSRTDTFLGERYRRLVKRMGKGKALIAVARQILVVVWHLLADPTTIYHELGPNYHARRIDTDRKVRAHVAQLAALGFTAVLEPIAAA